MTGDLSYGLEEQAALIYWYVGVWRDLGYENPPTPECKSIPPLGERDARAVKGAHDAIREIDKLTRQLAGLRAQLVSELAENEARAAGQPFHGSPDYSAEFGRGPGASRVASCGRCGSPVARPGERRPDGALGDRALWCDRCIDRCHEATDFAHVCQLCATPEEAAARGWAAQNARVVPTGTGRGPVSHLCPVARCNQHVSPYRFMCRPHWYAVPSPLRDAVWITWRSGAGVGSAGHTAAILAAVGAVDPARVTS